MTIDEQFKTDFILQLNSELYEEEIRMIHEWDQTEPNKDPYNESYSGALDTFEFERYIERKKQEGK